MAIQCLHLIYWTKSNCLKSLASVTAWKLVLFLNVFCSYHKFSAVAEAKWHIRLIIPIRIFCKLQIRELFTEKASQQTSVRDNELWAFCSWFVIPWPLVDLLFTHLALYTEIYRHYSSYMFEFLSLKRKRNPLPLKKIKNKNKYLQKEL